MKNIVGKFFCAALLFMSICDSPAQATEITVGLPTIVARPTDIEPFLNQITGTKEPSIDAPLTTFISGGERYWLNSLGAETHKYQGTLDQPFQKLLWNRQSQLTYKDPLNVLGGPWKKLNTGVWTFDGGAPWIVNLYQASEKELLAIVHVEQPQVLSTGYTVGRSSIGLAWSSDAGESFTFLGDIIRYNHGYKPDYNVQGAPYLIKDGYLYVYYHDVCIGHVTTVARAPLAEVLTSARAGKTSPWRKYSTAWESDGLGGGCGKVNIETGIDHTDAAFSTHTNKYYFVLTRGAYGPGIDTWIKLYESNDLINWQFVKTIAQEPYPSEGRGYQYVTIVDGNGGDNGVVGKSFYIYSAKNVKNASVYRWLVTLDNQTAPIPGDFTDSGDTATDQVNLYDYNKLIANFGNPYTLFDYSALVGNFHR